MKKLICVVAVCAAASAFAQGKKAGKEMMSMPMADMKFEAFGNGAPIEFATAWGDGKKGPHGTVMKFKGPFTSPPHVHTNDMHCIVIKGTMDHYEVGKDAEKKPLGPGSTWFTPGKVKHVSECTEAECMAYCTQDKGMDSIVDPKDMPKDMGAAGKPAEGEKKPEMKKP